MYTNILYKHFVQLTINHCLFTTGWSAAICQQTSFQSEHFQSSANNISRGFSLSFILLVHFSLLILARSKCFLFCRLHYQCVLDQKCSITTQKIKMLTHIVTKGLQLYCVNNEKLGIKMTSTVQQCRYRSLHSPLNPSLYYFFNIIHRHCNLLHLHQHTPNLDFHFN